jgi:hypothetical protein
MRLILPLEIIGRFSRSTRKEGPALRGHNWRIDKTILVFIGLYPVCCLSEGRKRQQRTALELDGPPVREKTKTVP